MTVKCMNATQKESITTFFLAKTYTQRELAKQYKTSERTIHRVLVEAGIATTVPRIKGEAYNVMQMLKKFEVCPLDLPFYLKLAKQVIKKMEEDEAQAELSNSTMEFDDVPH